MARVCRAILIDLSGTLHIGNNAIRGAIEALERLRSKNVKIRFVTNTTKESKKALLSRLRSIGFTIEEHEIFTSLTVTRDYLRQNKLHPYFMLEKSALEDFEGINTENPNAVVVGLAPSMFNYEEMNKVFKMLLEQKLPLIAVHKARRYKREDGHALGPGPFVAALEYAANIRAEVMGKPNPDFFHSCLCAIECHPHEAVMIGDDVIDDVGGAQNAGLKGILVKTVTEDHPPVGALPKLMLCRKLGACAYLLYTTITKVS